MGKTKIKEKTNKNKDTKVKVAGLKGGQKVKSIEVDLPEESQKEGEGISEKTATKRVKPKIRSKKYTSAKAKIDRSKFYKPAEAIKLLKETSYSKFDGSIELHAVVKKVGISANVTLPHQAGKAKKVELANDETIEKLKKGKIDFDVLLATAEMMPKLVAFAKVLGPRGLMPNPKNATLIKSADDAKKFSTSAISIKTEKEAPVMHILVGKISMNDDQIKENLDTIFKAIGKGQTVKAFLSPSMGPSVKLEV